MSANELNIVISRLESELSLKKRVIDQYREKAEAFAVQQENFKQQYDAFQKEKDLLEKTIQKINNITSNTENIVVLNIGGSTFATTVATLSSNESIFRPILSGQFCIQKTQSGEIFIDRDPRMFPLILNYLRGELDVLLMRYKELSYSEMLQFRKDSAFYATKIFHLQEVSIERNREEIDDYWSYDGKTDALEFEINKEATLTSITLFADDKFTAKMTIECDDAELYKERRAFKGDSNGRYVWDGLSLNLLPNKRYTIFAKLSGARSIGGDDCRAFVSSDSFVMKFYNYKGDSNNTTVSKGQFPNFTFQFDHFDPSNEEKI